MTSGRYATDTRVSVERSKAEIEATLARYGADQLMYGWEASRAVIGFRCSVNMVRFILALPTPESDAFILTPTGKRRTATAAEKVYQQAVRQRWRALTLIVKAKLEAIETGITTFEEEFLSYIVLPDNSTVGETLLPQLEDTYRTGEMPPMLPATPPGSLPAAE